MEVLRRCCAGMAMVLAIAGCGEGAGGLDASIRADAAMDATLDSAVDASTDADADGLWYLDEEDRAAACVLALAERRARCGNLYCNGRECPPPAECGDVIFEPEGTYIECGAGQRVEDGCGRGCLSARGEPPLCGVGDRVSCGPDMVCTGGCNGTIVACEPRPVECAPADARIACLCDQTPHWDGCEARRNGLVVAERCNFFGWLPCDAERSPGRGDCTTPEFEHWWFDGETCVSTPTCSEPAPWGDRGSCLDRRARNCPNGTQSTLRPCRNNSVCDPYEICLFPPSDSCGRAGTEGRCQTVNQGCYRVGLPEVCGCDGVTYDGTCGAIVLAKTPVDHLGACEPRIP